MVPTEPCIDSDFDFKEASVHSIPAIIAKMAISRIDISIGTVERSEGHRSASPWTRLRNMDPPLDCWTARQNDTQDASPGITEQYELRVWLSELCLVSKPFFVFIFEMLRSGSMAPL